MKKLIIIIWLIGAQVSWGDDYKSASKFSSGDVVSAEVLNDILERIELALKAITPDELVGSWSTTWRTCLNGGPGNCSDLNVGTGWAAAVDGLYRTRSDTWVISDDGDGTYSVAMDKCFQGAVSGAYYNDSCSARLGVDSGILILGTIAGAGVDSDADHSDVYNIKRVSSSRYTVWKLASGSGSFVSFTLDKMDLAPEAPSKLELTVSSNSISQAWTASTGATSYDVHRKTTATGTFSSIGTPSTVSYVDSDVTAGGTYWYRVFAKSSDGTSLGSSVVKVTYNP